MVISSRTELSQIENVVYYEADISFFNDLTQLIESTQPLVVQYFFCNKYILSLF